MNLNRNQRLLFSFISAVLLSFYVEVYVMAVETCLDIQDFVHLFSFVHYILIFIVLFILLNIIYDNDLRRKFFDFLYNYRVYISIAVLAFCVIFQIHGSSINELNIFHINHAPILGISRNVRTDEFVVSTLMAFSQYHNGFAYFSDIIRAAPTDMFIIYGQAVLDIAVIFRPFNIGYLFLDPARGLSFFWISRLIALALVSLEMGMLITNRDKKLSLIYVILVVFSPLVQWWFAINGLVEQLIFGQLGVLLINFYMNTEDYKKRLLAALLMIVCVGGFLIVFYPSWQIPFAYVFILMAGWIFFKNKSDFKYDRKDLGIILAALAIFAILMAHILNNSLETIKIIMNTAYPAGELFNGEGLWHGFFSYLPTLFFPFTDVNLPINVVEHSVFIDFFPIPIIISLIVLYQKTKDKLLIGLLALYFVFAVLYFVPLPDLIITVTLREHIKNSRFICVITFIGLVMLIRALASLKEIASRKVILIISAVLSVIVVYASSFYFGDYYLKWMILSLVVIYAVSFYAIFNAHSQRGKTLFLLCVIFISFTAGSLVNPIDCGSDVVYKNDFIGEVDAIVHQDPNALWLVQNMPLNYLTAAGAKTINSVNIYPDLDRWHSIDVNNNSEELYNRYAHIVVAMKNDSDTNFTLITQDVLLLNLNVGDLEKLNVSYIATNEMLEKFNNDNITFDKSFEHDGYKIYHVTYH